MLKKILRGSPGTFIIRWLASAVLIFGAYNPSGHSVFHYLRNSENPTDAWNVLLAIVTILLLIGLFIATFKTLGIFGKVVFAIFFAAVAYLFLQEGWMSTDSPNTIIWFSQGCLSFLGGVGLAGSILWRRVTGQIVTDEAGDFSVSD